MDTKTDLPFLPVTHAGAADVRAPELRSIDGLGGSAPTEEETYSDGEGPECPRCHAVWTADDKKYFDEANGMKMKCSCGAQLFIQPETRTTWTTTVVS